jgi:hypothetical protein
MTIDELFEVVAQFAIERYQRRAVRLRIYLDDGRKIDSSVLLPVSNPATQTVTQSVKTVLKSKWRKATVKPLPATEEYPSSLLPFAKDFVPECDTPAVYFLIKSRVVVYVGSSTRPMKRVQDHAVGTLKTIRKDFDWFALLPVPLDSMLQNERNFVALLDPVHNKNLKEPPAEEGDESDACL